MTTVKVTTTRGAPVAARVIVTQNNGRQRAAVYKLSKPIKYGDNNALTRFVWVSTVHVPLLFTGTSSVETMAFACDAHGSVLDWGGLTQLHGAHIGHADALADIGYTTVIDAMESFA